MRMVLRMALCLSATCICAFAQSSWENAVLGCARAEEPHRTTCFSVVANHYSITVDVTAHERWLALRVEDDGRERYVAILPAEAPLTTDDGPSLPLMTLTCDGESLSAIMDLGSPIETVLGSRLNVAGNKRGVMLIGKQDRLLFADAAGLLTSLLDESSASVDITPTGRHTQQVRFRLAGMLEALQQVRESCGLVEPPRDEGDRDELHVLTEPVLKRKFAATYPKRARRLGVRGKVTLHCKIDRRGRPGHCAVDSAEPSGWGFEQAAVKAIAKWRYTPGMKEGEPIEVWISSTFTFEP